MNIYDAIHPGLPLNVLLISCLLLPVFAATYSSSSLVCLPSLCVCLSYPPTLTVNIIKINKVPTFLATNKLGTSENRLATLSPSVSVLLIVLV